VRQIQVTGGTPRATRREAKASWFSPQRHEATFIVLGPGKPGTPPLGSVAALRAMFGPPQHVYRIGPDTVLTYRKNLLAELR
jgi:hypothetical protein